MVMDPEATKATDGVAATTEMDIQDLHLLALHEEFSNVLAKPEGLSTVCELAHCIDLVNKVAPTPYLHQFCMSKEEERWSVAILIRT